MWESAAAALKWLVDTLITNHREAVEDRRKRWDRVADFLDKVASVIDSAAADFRAGKIPYGHHAQLINIGHDFGEIVSQVFTDADHPRPESPRARTLQEGDRRRKRSKVSPSSAASGRVLSLRPGQAMRSEATNAFHAAVHIIDQHDTTVLEGSESPQGPIGKKVLTDLEIAAGKFRGLAIAIRAKP